MQHVLFWIKPIAEHIGRLTFPRDTHFYCREYWKLFFRRELLQRGDGIHTIMIGDGYQAKSFTHQVPSLYVVCICRSMAASGASTR